MRSIFIITILLFSSSTAKSQLGQQCEVITAWQRTQAGYEVDLSMLDTADFYLAGEVHQIAHNELMSYSLFKGLNQKFGVNNIIVEYGHSVAFLMNRFVQTGDTSILRRITKSPATLEYLQKAAALYAQNDTAHRFRYWGVDFEIDMNRYYWYNAAINLLFAGKHLPIDLKAQIEAAMVEPSEKKTRTLNNYLKSTFSQYESLYHELLKQEFVDFEIIINASDRFTMSRDRALFAKFTSIIPLLSHIKDRSPKCFAQFGMIHVSPSADKSFRNLVYQNFSKKLITIGYHYYNCKERVPNGNIITLESGGAINDKSVAEKIKETIENSEQIKPSDALAIQNVAACYEELKGIDLLLIFRN